MKQSYPSFQFFIFVAFFVLMVGFAVGGCKKEAKKDCGCGSTVVTSVSNKNGLLIKLTLKNKTRWQIYVSQPEEVINHYTGIICNTEVVEELITKEGLEDKVASPDMEPIAIVFSGDLFKTCTVKDDPIIALIATYSFDLHLDTISLAADIQ